MKHRVIPSRPLKSSGHEPWERYVTSYNTDYRPFSERHLQVDQLNRRTDVEPAPALIIPRQSSKQEPWERYVTSYNSDYRPFSERHLQVDQLNHRTDADAPSLITPRQSSKQEPWERYVTSYNSDYKPFSERHLQFHQLNPRNDAEPAPAFIAPLQTKREIWPVFNYYFYKTTNSTYGPPAQPPSCCLFPSRSPYGILAASVSGATGVAGPAQGAETGRSLGVEKNGQLHSKVLVQCEAKDEPRRKINVLYERGTFVVSSDTACCAEFLGSVCREAGLQHLLNLPVASSPIIANKDAENWECGAYLGSSGLENSIVLQPTSCWCNFCGRTTERPRSLNLEVQTVPPHIAQGSSPPPQDHEQPTVRCTEPLLTEYQTSYSAQWPEPTIQLRDYHYHPRPCHWNPHTSL